MDNINMLPKHRFSVLAELRSTIKHWPVVSYMALSDTRARYRRSVIGPWWLSIGTLIGTLGLGWLWSQLLKMPFSEFVPTLTTGLISWQLVSGVILESSGLYVRNATIIRNIPLPFPIYPLQLLMRHLINFLHNIPVFLLVAWVAGLSIGLESLMLIPGLVILILNLFWLSLFISILGARYRDLEYIIAAIMPLALFISPVFYRPDYLPVGQHVLWFNPLSHLIEIMRAPLLGYSLPGFVWMVNIGMLVVGAVCTLWLFRRERQQIAFWV